MPATFCGSCGRRGKEERLPRGWKACDDIVLCVRCRRQRYRRFRSVRVAVEEPIGCTLPELRVAAAESGMHSITRNGSWDAQIAEGRPVLRVLVANRWCELHLKDAAWRAGQRTAFEKIASGEAAGELLFYGAPTDGARRNRPHGDPHPHAEYVCRIVAWLPREQAGDAGRPPALRDWPDRLDPSACRIEEMGIADLREAVRANRVSFPSQVPTFPKHDRPDLQPKLAHLYFVMGWNCKAIGGRYRLTPQRVRRILEIWKCRAAQTGYIQHIPPPAAFEAACGTAKPRTGH